MKKGILFLQKFLPETLHWFRLPALISWIGLSIGVYVSSTFIPFLPTPPTTIHLTAIVVVVSLLSIAVFWNQRCIRFIFFFVIGILIFQIKVASYNREISEISSFTNAKSIINGTVVTNPSLSGNYFQFQILADSIVSGEHVYKNKHTLIAQGPIAPLFGAHISLMGTIKCPKRTRTPFIFNEFEYLFSNGIYGRVFFESFKIDNVTPSGFHAINNTFRSYVLDVIENLTTTEHRSLLRAAFLGEKTFLPENIKLSFRKSGIYHLLAISGLHAGMLIGAAYFILMFLPINTTIKHCIVLIILWTYQTLIGWSPSLIRATVMATIVIGTFFFEKKRYSLQSLGIAGIVLLMISPSALFNPGYQLSFCASMAIIMLFPRLSQFTPSVENPILNKIILYTVSSFFISVSGFLGTAPILLYHFGTLSLLGLVANIAAVLIMSVAMWLFFLSLILYPLLSFIIQPLIYVIASLFSLLIKLSTLSDIIPFSEIVLPVPWPEIIVLYVILLLTGSAIDKKYYGKYTMWALPTFILLSTCSVFLRHSQQHTFIMRFTAPKFMYTAIQWPGGDTWLITDPGYSFDKNRSHIVFDTWMRHTPGSHLTKAFILTDISNTSKRNKYDTSIHSESQSTTTSQIFLPTQFNSVPIGETEFHKPQQCSCFVTTSSTIPVLHIAQGKSSHDIPLTGLPPKKEILSIIQLDGNKRTLKTYEQ